MSAYQSNAGFDRSQLHHIGQQSGEPPTPCSRMGGCSTSNRLPPVATERTPWAAKRSEQRGGAGGTSCKLVRAQRLADDILK